MYPKTYPLHAPIAVVAALICLSSVAFAAETVKKTTTPPAVSAPAPAKAAQEVIATVNGKPVYAVELRRAKKVLMSGQPDLLIPPDRQKEFDLQALGQLTSAELLYQAGQKLEIKDLEKQVEDKIVQGKAKFGKPEDFEKAIQALDMTEDDLRDYTRRDITISNFIQQSIAAKVAVSDEETKKFYDQNPDKFSQSESVRASHILIGIDAKTSAADKKKAREKAEKLHKEIIAGADFAALAKSDSTCPSSQQGGDLGYFVKGQMVPPFEQAAFALKPGEVSNVVETQFGYHIIKVTDKKKAETVAYKDVKPRIDEYLKGQKISEAVNAYLTEARKTAKIEILLK